MEILLVFECNSRVHCDSALHIPSWNIKANSADQCIGPRPMHSSSFLPPGYWMCRLGVVGARLPREVAECFKATWDML